MKLLDTIIEWHCLSLYGLYLVLYNFVMFSIKYLSTNSLYGFLFHKLGLMIMEIHTTNGLVDYKFYLDTTKPVTRCIYYFILIRIKGEGGRSLLLTVSFSFVYEIDCWMSNTYGNKNSREIKIVSFTYIYSHTQYFYYLLFIGLIDSSQIIKPHKTKSSYGQSPPYLYMVHHV